MKKREELLMGMEDRYSLFGLLFAFGSLLQQTGDLFYKEITSKQFFFLICLGLFQEEIPTINDLSQVMGCSHQNVKQIALKLEKNGFIKLIVDKDDKRKLRIHKTKQLEDFAHKYNENEKVFMFHLYEGISEADITTTYQVMSQLEDNLTKLKETLV